MSEPQIQSGGVPGINLFRHSTDAVTMEPGEVLFREGDPGDVMYAIVEGMVDLTVDGAIIRQTGAGGIVGEMALLDNEPRSATATVSATARVVTVDRDRFIYLVQEHPTFALEVMKVMADRLRHP